MYNCYAQGDERACGGASVLIRQGTLHSVVPLQTNIQAVAVRLTLHVALTLCSIYIPPSTSPSVAEGQALLDQLPQPFLLVGDFNAHNPLWGSTNYNNRGKVLEDIIADNNLCIFNDDSHTYLHPATGHYSALDLSLCSPSLIDEFSWSVHSDLGGSDHFPIILKTRYSQY
jgi:endonuclease/exonuclease/phosphatase (EEP) superfamily protein YafD